MGKKRRTDDGELVPAACRTWYDGTLFRSYLESLWARLFDAAGVRWAYEPQRYYLGNASYLPDFWLYGPRCHVEVKPVSPDYGPLFLARMLAEWTARPVYFVIGKPAVAEVWRYRDNGKRLAWEQADLDQLFIGV